MHSTPHDINRTLRQGQLSRLCRGKKPLVELDSDAEDGGLTAAGQELHRILRKARISSGSEDGDGASSSSSRDGGEDVSEEEEFNDDIDLDEMASGMLPKASLLCPQAHSRSVGDLYDLGRKRFHIQRLPSGRRHGSCKARLQSHLSLSRLIPPSSCR